MAIPITIPRLGWNMEQGVFLGWLKPDGAAVRAGEPLFTLESDKATEDIEGLEDGILHIPADGPRKGDLLAVGTVIGYLLQPHEPIPSANKPSSAPPPAAPTAADPAPLRTDASNRDRPASSPRARRTASRLGVDWRNAKPSGRTGRIRERDVLTLSAPAPSLRRLIAERMMTSHRSTAPVTLTTTIDATELVNLRKQWKAAPLTLPSPPTGGEGVFVFPSPPVGGEGRVRGESNGEIVPSYTDLFAKLTALALVKHPILNSRWEDDRIVTPEGIHIGIAVDTEAGLLVPVVRDVPRLSLKELAMRSRDLIDRARQRKLAASELQGGTFTITSLGAFGIDAFTPIIHYPQCAILGIGRIRRCPAVMEDQIVIRDQVALSLTFDHRITDGVPAARFLQTLSALIENPRAVL